MKFLTTRFCRILFFTFIWFCLVSNTSAASVKYGAEENPTGDPIGGGIGYRNIILPSAANYLVNNKTELISALASATSGQIIYVADNAKIDLTGEKNIKIPGGVTLASGRGRNSSEGGLIFTNEYSSDLYFLEANGEKVHLTGLRLFGPDLEIGDYHYKGPYFQANGILSHNLYLEVDNCELAGWGLAAIHLGAGAANTSIHHNYIHHNRRSGHGYGVAHSVSTDLKPINSIIEANIFDYNRHHIMGNGSHGNSYEARYNICLEHDNGHCFDMHGQVDTDGTISAGDWIKIHHNSFRDREVNAVGIRGKPRNEAQIHNNWFYHPVNGYYLNVPAITQVFATGNLTAYDNLYEMVPPPETVLPVSIAKADTTSGLAPLKVVFDGCQSYGPNGNIVSYSWYFGDGSSAIGSRARGSQAAYTFNDPGRYNVILEVRDDQGIPSPKSTIPVTVFPSTGNCLLSFWIKDSYRGTLTNYYKKEVLLDGVVVWTADVAGDDGWVHVLTDVSSQAAGKDQVTLTLRVRCLTDIAFSAEEIANQTYPNDRIISLCTYWDDLVLFGFETKNGDFESAANWKYSESASVWQSGGFEWDMRSASDARSGQYSYMILSPYMENNKAGSWAQIQQVVINASPVVVTHSNPTTAVSADGNITVTFSKPMNQNSAEKSFSLNPPVEGTFLWQGNMMLFDPAYPFSLNENYHVIIAASAQDLSGKNLAAAYTWQFSIINQPATEETKTIVYPNPYIAGKSSAGKISFSGLNSEAILRIYKIGGELIEEIIANNGQAEWKVSAVSGGVYLYVVTSPEGVKKGKLSVIK